MLPILYHAVIMIVYNIIKIQYSTQMGTAEEYLLLLKADSVSHTISMKRNNYNTLLRTT